MAGFVNSDWTNLMLNWIDTLNSMSFHMAESTTASSDSKVTLPSSASTPSSPDSLPKLSKSPPSKQKKRKTSKKNKVKKPSKSKQGLLPVVEMSTNVSNDLLMDIQHGNEGFDLHIASQVCDDGRPTMGEEASSYFLMRHGFTFPGPLTIMSQGPMAQILGAGGYRISAEAVHKDKYVLVGNYSNNTVEGVWEQTWTNKLKTHLTFVAGFESMQQRQMAMLMAQQHGMAMPENRFPAAICFADYRSNNWATRLHLDMMNNQLSCSFNRRLYSISNELQIGGRMVSCYEKRKTSLEFSSKYQWKSLTEREYLYKSAEVDGNEGSKEMGDNSATKSAAAMRGKGGKSGLNTIEAIYNLDSTTLQLCYTKNVTENAALTSRLMWKCSTWNQLMASLGYRYQFGRHPGISKVICGEMAADGNFRQSITFPLLRNMVCKFYAEINHFLSPQQMQNLQFPHKLGFTINIHL